MNGYHGNERSNERLIHSGEAQIERKNFLVELRENTRGRFLRITEESHGRRNSIIVPSTGLDDFANLLDDAFDADDDNPQEG
ncbi:MAG: DNA-binding protein [Chthoniobacterales bacterium]